MNEDKLLLVEQFIDGRDKDGNRYVVADGKIKLYLKHEHHGRNIGTLYVNANGMVVYSKSEEEAQKHLATDSWSINERVFRNVDVIIFRSEINTYTIDQKTAKEYGVYLYFKETTELKLYVEVKHWKKKKKGVKPNRVEPKIPPQTDMFNHTGR
jgi:hypothetical protein